MGSEMCIRDRISPEERKFGLNPDDLSGALKEIHKLANVRVKGLMAIAPLVENAEGARPYFRILRKLRDSIDANMVLSMGMTDDFEVAIEEGADIIRIGRGIFE